MREHAAQMVFFRLLYLSSTDASLAHASHMLRVTTMSFLRIGCSVRTVAPSKIYAVLPVRSRSCCEASAAGLMRSPESNSSSPVVTRIAEPPCSVLPWSASFSSRLTRAAARSSSCFPHKLSLCTRCDVEGIPALCSKASITRHRFRTSKVRRQ